MERPTAHETKAEDISWTNPLKLHDFRQKYLCRVYTYFTIQFAIVGVVIVCFAQVKPATANLHKEKTLVYFCLAILAVSYGLLYIQRFNHPNKKMSCLMMQVQFTIFLATSLGLLCTSFNWYAFSYVFLLLCLSSAIISIGYCFSLFEFHQYHGIRLIFYVQCCLVGLFTLVPRWMDLFHEHRSFVTRDSLDALVISSLVMMYFAYGTIRMVTTNNYIQYRMENFLFGVVLIYTTPILSVYYKPTQPVKR